MKKHRHRWGRKIGGVANGPIRVCQSLGCGAVRYASGYIGGDKGGGLIDTRKQKPAT